MWPVKWYYDKKNFSLANVALNLQPKAIETNESAHTSTAIKETQDNKNKVRKTDGASISPVATDRDEKMELTAQSTNAGEGESKHTLPSSDIVQNDSSQPKQEEKMEIGSTEPSTELADAAEDHNDIGEVHIVSVEQIHRTKKLILFDFSFTFDSWVIEMPCCLHKMQQKRPI